MAIKTDLELKQYFETNDVPTQQQYFDLIDSKQNVGSIAPAISIGSSIVGSTVGSVLFVGSGSVLQQSNADFFWDNVKKRLGLGTNTPDARITFYGDTNLDQKPLQIRYIRPTIATYNTNTVWISNIASQGSVDVGFQALAQQANGQGTRWSWSTTDDSLTTTATESMRLSQEKRLSVGSVLNNGATIDAFSAGLLTTNLALRVRNNGNSFNDFVVNGAGQTLIGKINTIEASALLQIDSNTRGVLLPRMTTIERNAISSPASGLLIWNTTTDKLNVYVGTLAAWREYHDQPA